MGNIKMGERLNPKYLRKSVKLGGGSAIILGMFSATGVGPLIQLHDRVIELILK